MNIKLNFRYVICVFQQIHIAFICKSVANVLAQPNIKQNHGLYIASIKLQAQYCFRCINFHLLVVTWKLNFDKHHRFTFEMWELF